MARSRRVARHVLMEEALDKALSTLIPEKDTGPEPEHILVPPAATMPSSEGSSVVEALSVDIVLDKKDRERAGRISDILFEITGERKETADALRVALKICRIDRAKIEKACKEIAGPAALSKMASKMPVEG